MKKIFLLSILFILLFFIFVPKLTLAWNIGDSLVPPCGGSDQTVRTPGQPNTIITSEPCGISDFFTMLANIYEFIVKVIATPLAVIALTIGGIMMMISAGNPNLMGAGKKILYAAIIGLVLVWCSWLIIDFILRTLGYVNIGTWNTL